jgi:hypothetical protein
LLYQFETHVMHIGVTTVVPLGGSNENGHGR